MKTHNRIPEWLHFELKVQAARDKLTMKQVANQLLKKWKEGELEPAPVNYDTTLIMFHVEIESEIIPLIKESGMPRDHLIAGLIKSWLEQSEKY